MARDYRYHLVDVFTDRLFGGNQLAVFPQPTGLQADEMQAIAKELNLSETTFVWPPLAADHDAHLRIFTPAVELPLAGHPTVGTAFVLARLGQPAPSQATTAITFREGVGNVPVTVAWGAAGPDLITMQQPLPTFGPRFEDRATLAELLSLAEADIDPDLPCEAVSCGVPFLFVPITSLAAIRQIRLRLDVWERAIRGFAAPHIFVFTRATVTPAATVHSRMFAPAMGIAEDPATGAASGPLGSYLVRYGVVAPADASTIISEQGYEMGRPSVIHISITQAEGEITRVQVGGTCVPVGTGTLTLA